MSSNGFTLHAALFLFAALILSVTPINGENRFFVEDQTVLSGSTGQTLAVKGDSDIDLYGYSFAIHYDGAVLAVTDVTWEGALATEPSFFDGEFDNDVGQLGYGCVFDFGPEFDNVLVPGTDYTLAVVTFDAAADTDTTTEVSFEEVPFNPARPIQNVMTNGDGFSEFPTVVSGMITVETRAPVITNLTGNAGFAGDTFTILGEHFDEPGLEVRVCDVVAEAVVSGGGTQIEVTAPADTACDPGDADVVVSTDRGSATEVDGYTYIDPNSLAPVIVEVNPFTGPAGTEVTISGQNFDADGLEVSVCDVVVAHQLQGANIVVTIPDCGDMDAQVNIVVTNNFGMDSATFAYTVEVAGGFIRGDTNGDGSVDIADPVFALNHLFAGGPGPECEDRGDFNDDGSFDVSDPIFVTQLPFCRRRPHSVSLPGQRRRSDRRRLDELPLSVALRSIDRR